jgi:endogenous inhibitor of DNA gyrase (YacG/DUF329 family)
MNQRVPIKYECPKCHKTVETYLPLKARPYCSRCQNEMKEVKKSA